MPTLIHGTTRTRAETIIRDGPNPRYREPGGAAWNDGFSMYLEGGPYMFDSPEEYARGKGRQCPNEGGPVILVLEDVPEHVIEAALRDGGLRFEDGLIQFDRGYGIEEFLAVWPTLSKVIRAL